MKDELLIGYICIFLKYWSFISLNTIHLKQSQSYLKVFLNYIICVHLPLSCNLPICKAIPTLQLVSLFCSGSTSITHSSFLLFTFFCNSFLFIFFDLPIVFDNKEQKNHFHGDHKSERNIFLVHFCCTGFFFCYLTPS